jgi:hypothetical protein
MKLSNELMLDYYILNQELMIFITKLNRVDLKHGQKIRNVIAVINVNKHLNYDQSEG